VKDKLKGVLIALAAVAAVGAGGAAIAGAAGGTSADDQKTEKAITGSALERASAVALKEVGSGKVTQTEAGDEEGAYEVEVTKPDGSQVDVHLDKQFTVLDSAADKEESGDDNSGPDADENEPGHQDEAGDGDGETNDD
jgi:uncharacterized membrane protein YkoI